MLVLASVLFWGTAAAEDRELHWREVTVQARLDAEGRLHVRERQAMVFTGDWNGGERAFRLSDEHVLELESIKRLDPRGIEIELAAGDLALTDRYDWSDSSTLRWRSRQPQDPPFSGTELTYILSYRLGNILVAQADDTYLLDHDFAFTERDGAIERFTLDLELDPVWATGQSLPRRLELGPLPPGEGAVVSVPLRYGGPGSPGAVLRRAPFALRFVLAAFLLAGVATLIIRLFRRERALGRFAPLPDAGAIDRAWIEAHVLSMRPEVVGAAYDHQTGAAEVAATIARMVTEKKLACAVIRRKQWLGHKDDLELSLLVKRSALRGYEKDLVRALFFSGSRTSTEDIRAHYAKRGFDPSALLRAPLQKQIRRLGVATPGHVASVTPLVVLIVATLVMWIIAGALRSSELPGLLWTLVSGLVILALATLLARRWRLNMSESAAASLKFMLPLAIGLQDVFVQLLGLEGVSWSAAAALTLWGLTLSAIVLGRARSRDAAEGIALRKRLAAARRYFERELLAPTPRLDDTWFPYLIALDLGRDLDRWFRAFGGEGARSASGGVFASTNGASHWTGGGGAFGGGGASGSWIAATGALAAGVAAPSSASSSGGGGGGGSSGGGGGGGW